MFLRNPSSHLIELICDCGRRYKSLTVAGTDWSGQDADCMCSPEQREAFDVIVGKIKELYADRTNDYLAVWVHDGRLFFTTHRGVAPPEAIIRFVDYITDNW